MPRGVRSVPAPQSDPAVLASDVFDEMMDGLPEEQREIPTHRIAGEDPAVPTPPGFIQEVPSDKVAVLNLRYPEETFFFPVETLDEQGNNRQLFVHNQYVKFINGQALVSEKMANRLKRACPYVHIEPREGDIFTFPQTGFQTRSITAYNEYVARYVDQQA